MRTLFAAGLAAGYVIAMSAHAQPLALPANLPAALKPAGLTPYLQVSATGSQLYTCSQSNGAWIWVFKAPDAQLFDTQKKQVGKHYAGPTWEALAGGKVVGAVKASAPGGSGNIPWLLLEVTSREGSGPFTDAKAILRIDTNGGVAPAPNCSQANSGEVAEVAYTANYVFLK